jgi:hypothetical protein
MTNRAMAMTSHEAFLERMFARVTSQIETSTTSLVQALVDLGKEITSSHAASRAATGKRKAAEAPADSNGGRGSGSKRYRKSQKETMLSLNSASNDSETRDDED